MGSMNRNKTYSGFIDSDDIIELNLEIDELQRQIGLKNDKIKKLRNECDHDFVILYEGAYDDTFICEHCGKRVER